MRRSFIVIISILILLLLLILMVSTRSQSNFRKQLSQNYKLLLPATAKATEPQITKTDWNKIAEWTIETDHSWQEYRTWLKNQVGETYRILSETENEISFRKTYHSEIHEITLTADEEDGNIHVVYSLSLW